MTTSTRTHTPSPAAAALAVVTLAVVATIAAVSARADTPPVAVGNTIHGFVFEDGALTTIDHPDAATVPSTPDGQTGTDTLGINDRGDIVGVYESPGRIVGHFVRDRKGRFTTIADPPGTSSDRLSYETVDINNRGEIVGFYNDEQGATTTGFLRDNKGRFADIIVPGSQVTAPFKINDRRQVVGLYVDDAGVHGFLWDDGEFETIDVPDATATLVYGINDRAQTVGVYVDAKGDYHGFLRDRDGDVTTIDAPGASQKDGGTQLVGINERGQIAGAAYDAQGSTRAFRYERGRFTWIEKPHATYIRAIDIDNRGRVVGDYGTKPAVPRRP